jgi:transposase
LPSELEKATETTPVDIEAYYKNSGGELVKFRLCALNKNAEAIAKSQKRVKDKERTGYTTASYETKFINNYIVLATSLQKTVTAPQILEVYRFRWQVELYFKRLKSLLDFGDVPNKKEENIIAWLNGKMVVALLIERLYAKADFFPSA